MPKTKETNREFLMRVTRQFPGVFRCDQSVLFCSLCNCSVNATKIFNIKQHIATTKHKEAAEKSTCSQNQTLLTEYKDQQHLDSFAMDLTKTFLEANIPIKKITMPCIQSFFKKYTTCKVPSEATLRQRYVPQLYQKSMEEMRARAANKDIWISVDETTDVEQRLVASFIFGVLETDEEWSENRHKPYLLNVSTLVAANASTIATFVNDSLILLWPDGIKYEKVLLMLTDAAAYMISAVGALQVMYPKMLHITCLAHGLHRIAEFIRTKFPEVNNLISSTKSVFRKCPSRRMTFQSMHPSIPLPPSPVLTRWGTWLKAAIYYADNFDEVKQVIETFNDDEAESIASAKQLFNTGQIKCDLSFIKRNFASIVTAIVRLEAQGLPLKTSIEILENIRQRLLYLEDPAYSRKMDAILKRNKGYPSLQNINKIINECCIIEDDEFVKNLSPLQLASFVFCPVTSADVERSFSAYGSILTEKRRSFTFANLKQYLIVYCNK